MSDRYQIRDVQLGYEVVDSEGGTVIGYRLSRHQAAEYCTRLNYQDQQARRLGANAIAIELEEMEAALSRPDRFDAE